MRKVLHVRPINSCSSDQVKLGKAILTGSVEATVTYRKQTWTVGELLQHLAERVQKLERTQCKPSAKCLFEGRDYLDEKYLGSNDDTSILSD